MNNVEGNQYFNILGINSCVNFFSVCKFMCGCWAVGCAGRLLFFLMTDTLHGQMLLQN